MAKKRKAGATAASRDPPAPAELDARDSRKRIKTFIDVADSDDEFHANRDEVRLGEDAGVKRHRKQAEREAFLELSDEEVLGHEEDEDDDKDQAQSDEAESHNGRGASSARTLRRSGDIWDDADDADDHAQDDESGWGMAKGDIYGADTIETEEQALAEEAEARRLQKRQLQSLNDADYGFDEGDWHGADANDKIEHVTTETEILPQLHISPGLPLSERLSLLQNRYPEFDPLSKDLIRLHKAHADLSQIAQPSIAVLTKLRAASAYLGALVMYFALLTSTASSNEGAAAPLPASELRDHPAMTSLVQCRELWLNIESLPEDILDDADDSGFEDKPGVDDLSAVHQAAAPQSTEQVKLSRAERHAAAATTATEQRQAERLRRTEEGLADLDELLVASSAPRTSKLRKLAPVAGDSSDLGEEAPLTEREAAEKAGRKRSLRFYTSQIAQKASKRGTAGRNAGGDDDIPYRERLRDRQARLNAEAEKRGKRDAPAGAELGDFSDDEDRLQAQQIRAENDDGYYDLVAARTSRKKADKAALADVQRQAALQGGRVVEDATVGADGKRKITYAIEKNKGLTPHRKKDVRNPRVKKRKKYDEKKKKLATMKAVYKGGEGRGGYGGELSGIKKNLVKSVKL